jgi:hypothetical protein
MEYWSIPSRDGVPIRRTSDGDHNAPLAYAMPLKEARTCSAALRVRISGLHWQRATRALGIRPGSLRLTDLAGPIGKLRTEKLLPSQDNKTPPFFFGEFRSGCKSATAEPQVSGLGVKKGCTPYYSHAIMKTY